MRTFNISGPCDPEKHYFLDGRLPEVEIRGLIRRQQYFVLHAPPCFGKTTALTEFARTLTAEGEVAAVVLTSTAEMNTGEDFTLALRGIWLNWREQAISQLPPDLRPRIRPDKTDWAPIVSGFADWATSCPRPLVVFLDDIDLIENDALIGLLRQIRSQFDLRPKYMPVTIGFVGRRRVRNYQVTTDGVLRENPILFFDITSDTLTLNAFSEADIAALYGQHTDETGRIFTPKAVEFAWAETGGHPWLVNALARQSLAELASKPQESVTREVLERAAKWVLTGHLPSILRSYLQAPGLRKLVRAIATGEPFYDAELNDFRFAEELGFFRYREYQNVVIDNPIYRRLAIDLPSGSDPTAP